MVTSEISRTVTAVLGARGGARTLPLLRRQFRACPASHVKRYERRYGPAAGVDVSEAEKKERDAKGNDAHAHKEQEKEVRVKSGEPPLEDSKPDASSQLQSSDDKKTLSDKINGDHASKKSENDGDPLETMFQMPDDASATQSQSSQLHEAPESTWSGVEPSDEYVHHFDTYSLVKDLQKGGFTEEQSMSIMKGIRGALSRNLKNAKNELMSKSQIENDSYLFKAASEELRNNIVVARASEVESQRTRRAQLQHELDILTQRMSQDFSGLKDDLKEMFNNQKISTRESQRSIDTAIQELNYQITVSLNSDGKSEVEGLRWILTRRAALAIGISAFMSIVALRYHSYKNGLKEREKQEAKLQAEVVEAAGKADTADVPETLYAEPIG